MPLLTAFWEIAEREYQSFSFDAQTRTTVRNIILAFCVGIILAAAYMFYQKQVPGAVVRAILRAEAFSAESAKTASELGIDRKRLLCHELERNTTLQRLIRTVEADGEVRHYIPEELKYRAEVRYEAKGNGLFGLIFTIVATIALGIAVIKLLPGILSIFDNFLK